MSGALPLGAVPSRRRAGPRAALLGLLVLVAALPRLWRFEAVGEGTDEAYSVTATRAILDGRFSYGDLDDFAVDAYQAKLCPVAEAVAAGAVALLGDRPAAFRLPSLLASLALLLLLVRFAARRFGPLAALGVAALAVLDLRSVVYAQTHRYVAIEQLLAFLLLGAVVRAERVRTVGSAALVLLLGLLLFHTHLLAILVLVGLGVAAAWDAWRTRSLPVRPPVVLLAFLVLAVHAALVLALFEGIGLRRFFASEGGLEALRRAAASTVRAVGGQGVVAGPLGLVGSIALLRTRSRADRALALAALVPLALFALASLRLPLAPRYALTAQPFLWLAGGAAIGRGLDALRRRVPSRPRVAIGAGLAAVLALSALPTALYLRTGGGRDVEAPIHAALRAHATPGDAVLYDDALFDPFARRPATYPSVSRAPATLPNGEALLDAMGVRWVVRSSEDDDRAAYGPSLRARLRPVAASRVDRLAQPPLVLTLYRLER